MKRLFSFVIILTAGMASCKKDLLEPVCETSNPVTYDSDIKSIVDSNCTSSGCHGSGSSNGDYTTFSGMSSDINNGRMEREVLTDQTMPRGSSTLSQDEINLFQCWMENDFEEN